MRPIRLLVLGLIACGLTFFATNLSAQSTDQGIAKVVAIKGDARFKTVATADWQTLKVGMVLKPGAIVQTATGIGNYVDLVLNNSHAVAAPEATPSEMASYTPKAEQDGIRVYENTVLAIDKLAITHTGADDVTDTQLDLKAGKILGTVKKLSAASKYEVKIPNGVAGIRGTIYFLSADGVLSVLSGQVVLAVVGSDGNVTTQVVGAGQQYDSRTGQISPIGPNALGTYIHDAMFFRLLGRPPGPPPTTPPPWVHPISPTHGNNGGGPFGGGF